VKGARRVPSVCARPLLFIGPRGVTRTHARGLFHCPHCDVPRSYAYWRIRRFFALFFVPVVPLPGERAFVQCGFCRRAFDPAILATEAKAAPGAAPERASDPRLAGAPASTLLVWTGEGGD